MSADRCLLLRRLAPVSRELSRRHEQRAQTDLLLHAARCTQPVLERNVGIVLVVCGLRGELLHAQGSVE